MPAADLHDCRAVLAVHKLELLTGRRRLTARPPGTSAGSRTPSTPRTTGVGSNPCERIPCATSPATSRIQRRGRRRPPAPRPSRRRARSSRPAARPRDSTPRARRRRTATAGRRRRAAQALRASGLVVDQLVLAARQQVDAVDPPAQQVRAEVERERALEPHRLGLLGLEALAVALERGGRLAAQLPLLLGVAEARPPPAGVEQPEQLGERVPPGARTRRGSARAPGGRGSRSAGGSSAPAGSGRPARTCT